MSDTMHSVENGGNGGGREDFRSILMTISGT